MLNLKHFTNIKQFNFTHKTFFYLLLGLARGPPTPDHRLRTAAALWYVTLLPLSSENCLLRPLNRSDRLNRY